MREILYIFSFTVFTFISFAQEKNKSWRESYFSGQPMQIGNNVQFLFDDYVVDDKYGLNMKLSLILAFS